MNVSKISDAEWQVMKVIWDKSPITQGEIVEALKPVTGWSTTTIYTMINRLIKKDVVAIEEGSSPYKCIPLIAKDVLIGEESKSFIKRVYDGSLNLLMSSIVEQNELSDGEIEELKKILDKSKKKKGDL